MKLDKLQKAAQCLEEYNKLQGEIKYLEEAADFVASESEMEACVKMDFFQRNPNFKGDYPMLHNSSTQYHTHIFSNECLEIFGIMRSWKIQRLKHCKIKLTQMGIEI